MLRDQRKSLTPAWVGSWREPQSTTRALRQCSWSAFRAPERRLLDTILMGHPGTEVLEEEPTLLRATEALGGLRVGPGRYRRTDPELRETPISKWRATLTPSDPGKLLIDKNPLAMNQRAGHSPAVPRRTDHPRVAPSVRRCPAQLLRHQFQAEQRDGRTSCRLDTAAELYDLSFGYLEQARELFKPAVHTIVYENIVADRDRELRPLFEFLGLEWDERRAGSSVDRAKAAGTSRPRAMLRSSSRSTPRSAGRWRNYRKHLEPILPMLRAVDRKVRLRAMK